MSGLSGARRTVGSVTRTLLCGRAGSGKTHRVVQRLLELVSTHDATGRFERFAVVVPTYSQAEHLKRRLLRGDAGLPALLDRGIGTFEQLAERETGLRLHALAPAAVQDAVVVRALLEQDAEAFRDVRRFAGFRRAVLRLFKEVKASEPEPGPDALAAASERLAAAAGSIPGVRGERLEVLADLLSRYQLGLAALGLLDHEDLLRELLATLRERPPQDLRLFALDGFTDLTQVQERIVQSLAECADEALVTLLADPGGSEAGPFAASASLRRRLIVGSGLVAEALPGNPRLVGDLLRVERRAAGEGVEPASGDGRVRFLAGADPADEADRVARSCRRVAAEGTAWSDILVVVRRLDGDTGRRVLDALRRHGVPHRPAGGAGLCTFPAARVALCGLQLAAGAHPVEDALTLLAAGAARGVPDLESDALRERARLGVPPDVESLLALAARDPELPAVVAWLESVREIGLGPQPAPTARVADALLGALATLVSWSYEGRTDDETAARDAAAVQRVRSLVAESVAAVRAAGRDEITPTELVGLVSEAAQTARAAPRDARVDAINVVDAEEARTWEARAVVVAGLRMGEFPGAAREDLFLPDHDRGEVARASGVRLPARLDEALRRERLLFYSAVTRATDRLVLTAPLTDARGDPALPSPFLEELREILPVDERDPDGVARTPGDQRPEPGEAFGDTDLIRSALAVLGERHAPGSDGAARADDGLALLQAVAAELVDADGSLADDGVLVRAAIGRDPDQPTLSPDGGARARMTAPRARSASSLRDFVQCPYRHFAARGLDLEERQAGPDDGLSAMLAGNVAHLALERALDGGATTTEQAREHFESAWHQIAGRVRPSVHVQRERAEICAAVERVVTGAAPAPGFRPASFEQRVGSGPEGRDRLELSEDGHVVGVSGQIDRIDRDAAGRAIVLDYKWSRHGRYAGLERKIDDAEDLQLPLYALSLVRGRGDEVVAAGYLTLRDHRVRWLRLTEDAPGGRGNVDWTEDASDRLDAVARRIVELDGQIRSAAIPVLPRDRDQCAWCAYSDLCRVDEVSG